MIRLVLGLALFVAVVAVGGVVAVVWTFISVLMKGWGGH